MSEVTIITPRDLIEALESGNYAKGKDRLMIPGEIPMFCCLGVACQVAGAEILHDGDGSYIQYGYVNTQFLSIGESNLVGPDAPVWAPWLNPQRQYDLTNVNDDHDTWGPVIAELEAIELQLQAAETPA